MVLQLNNEVYDKVFHYFLSQTDREKMKIHRKIQELKQLVESIECQEKESEVELPTHKIQQIANVNKNRSLVLHVQRVPLLHAKLIVTLPEDNKEELLTSNFNENICSPPPSTSARKSFSQSLNTCSLSENLPQSDREAMTSQIPLECKEKQLFDNIITNEEQMDTRCRLRSSESEDIDLTKQIDSAYVSHDSLNQWEENKSPSSRDCDGEEPILDYLPVSYAHATLKKKSKWMKRWDSDISSDYYFCRTHPDDRLNSVKKAFHSLNKKWRQNWRKDALEENDNIFQNHKAHDNCHHISARVVLERFLSRIRHRRDSGPGKNAVWVRSWSTPTNLNVLTSSKYRYQQWRAKSK